MQTLWRILLGFFLPQTQERVFFTPANNVRVMATGDGKSVMVVGVDDSEQSTYALEWTLDRFFAPYAPNYPFKLFIVHAKPNAVSAVGLAGPGTLFAFTLESTLLGVLFWAAMGRDHLGFVNLCVLGTAEVVPYVDADLKHTAAKVVEKAKAICQSRSVRSCYYQTFKFVLCVSWIL